MPESSKNSQQSRHALLSLVMLCVLLISIAAAWMVTKSRGSSQEKALEILRNIRTQTLSAIWGSGDVESWYLGRGGDEGIVGWRRTTRKFTGDQYEGTLYHADRNLRVKSTWALNPTATTGTYLSDLVTPQGRLITQIEFQDGVVSISSNLLRVRVHGAAPPEYIPEGLDSAVYLLLARDQEQASFRMVFDNEPVLGSRLNFRPVTVRGEGGDRVHWTTRRRGSETIYQFDSQGLIERIEFPTERLIYDRVNSEEILKHFPDARRLIAPKPEESETHSP